VAEVCTSGCVVAGQQWAAGERGVSSGDLLTAVRAGGGQPGWAPRVRGRSCLTQLGNTAHVIEELLHCALGSQAPASGQLLLRLRIGKFFLSLCVVLNIAK